MNDISELPNQSLLLRHNACPDVHLKDELYREICHRLTRWGKIPDQRNHMPKRVVLELFRRQMRQIEQDANGVYTNIPPDRKENDKIDYNIDWFMGEDEEEDLFKV